MKIALIAAMGENRVIGNRGRLPWGHLPADWDNLFRVTAGKVMIMGRKSYDTPDRVWSSVGNFVVTRQANFPLDEGFERVESLEKALNILRGRQLDEVFVIGGGEIFKEAILIADRIHLTVVRGTFEGDAFFPEIDPSVFALVREQHFEADANNRFGYSFLVYERR